MPNIKTCNYKKAKDGETYIDIGPALWGNDCQYYLIMGERSNGKTYSAIKCALENYVRSGYRTNASYIRRWEEDLKGNERKTLCDAVMQNEDILGLTNNCYDSIVCRGRNYYLARYDDELDKYILDDNPFLVVFYLNAQEHYKSANYSNMDLIITDELLTRRSYLPDEFVTFVNLVSTIARRRKGVKVLMLSNTVSRSSIYFREMGLTKVMKDIQQGNAQIVTSKQGTKIYIEYCADTNKISKSKNRNVMFGFDNPRLEMIRTGAWEVAMYPHKPFVFKPSDVRFTFFIIWEDEIKRCQIVSAKDPKTGIRCDFLYIMRNISNDRSKLPKGALIYYTGHSPLPNYRRKITRPTDQREVIIGDFFRKEKVFFEDNELGDDINNYINWCGNRQFMQ